jgi:DNA-binding PadR family transcriptional regulator
MSTISSCELALLVLLSEGPAHPYQIEKTVEERDMRYWTELSMSSIYKTLRQLETKGLALSEVSLSERNVGRKTYALTQPGKDLLASTLREYLSVPEKERWRIDLATSHLDLLERDEVAAALDKYRSEVEKLISGYEALEKYLVESGCPEHALALARRPHFRYEAELRWLDDYRSRLGLGAGEEASPVGSGARDAVPGGAEGRKHG